MALPFLTECSCGQPRPTPPGLSRPEVLATSTCHVHRRRRKVCVLRSRSDAALKVGPSSHPSKGYAVLPTSRFVRALQVTFALPGLVCLSAAIVGVSHWLIFLVAAGAFLGVVLLLEVSASAVRVEFRSDGIVDIRQAWQRWTLKLGTDTALARISDESLQGEGGGELNGLATIGGSGCSLVTLSGHSSKSVDALGIWLASALQLREPTQEEAVLALVCSRVSAQFCWPWHRAASNAPVES